MAKNKFKTLVRISAVVPAQDGDALKAAQNNLESAGNSLAKTMQVPTGLPSTSVKKRGKYMRVTFEIQAIEE